MPSVITGGLHVKLVAQLGPGAVAANWKVDLYEFVGKDDWTNIGDLTGGETAARFSLYPLLLCCLGRSFGHLFSVSDVILRVCGY